MSIKICVATEGMCVGNLASVRHRTASTSVLRAGATRPSVAGPVAALGVSKGLGFHLFGVRIRTFTNQGVRISMRGAIRVGLTKPSEQATKP